MSGQRFRFIHASDLHLEAPVCGVDEVPDHLRDVLLDAPFLAAGHLFEAAVAERVDFVLLAGDVVNLATSGPRALDFLDRHFRALQEESIGVYWCESREDHLDRWPSAVPLSANVHIFSSDHVEPLTVLRDQKPLVRILGTRSSESGAVDVEMFEGDPSLFTIALAHGYPDAELADGLSAKSNIDYWALGGLHNAREVEVPTGLARYSGSPQGRIVEEEGSHGISLVEAEGRHAVRQTIATDAIRWHHQILELPDHIDQQGLLRMLRDQTRQLADGAAGRQLLVRWTVTDGDQLADTRSDILAARLREGGLANELLTTLRREFGAESPGVWSVSLEVEPPEILPSGWYEEDTVLGDLLRGVQQHQANPALELQLDAFDPAGELTKAFKSRMLIRDDCERKRVLRQLAALGVDLMRGDRVLAEDADQHRAVI